MVKNNNKRNNKILKNIIIFNLIFLLANELSKSTQIVKKSFIFQYN